MFVQVVYISTLILYSNIISSIIHVPPHHVLLLGKHERMFTVERHKRHTRVGLHTVQLGLPNTIDPLSCGDQSLVLLSLRQHKLLRLCD